MTSDPIHILLVEDDKIMVRMLKKQLNNDSFKLTAANNGLQALKLLQEITPDIIISDIMMPEMDGFAFRKHLLQREEWRSIPFIFLSAKVQPDDIIKGYQFLIDDYITKPIDPKILRVKIESILNKYREFNNLIRFDTLTNLYNRRALESLFYQELNRVRRYNQNLSVLLLDVDFFKGVNDRYGHTVGDEVLKRLSDMFKHELRKVDIAARYGGEEFVVLMPETDKNIAYKVATRLRQQSERLTFSEKDLRVTISGGISAAPTDGVQIHLLIEKADKAMYRAKQNGRNRIEFFS